MKFKIFAIRINEIWSNSSRFSKFDLSCSLRSHHKSNHTESQWLTPFAFFGLTHAQERKIAFANPNKRKMANAICSFVAHPPPGNGEENILNNENILYCNQRKPTFIKLKMRMMEKPAANERFHASGGVCPLTILWEFGSVSPA